MMLDDEFRELLIDDLRERKRERIAGHTLAVLHDDVRGMGVQLANLAGRVDRLEVKTGSGRPPAPPRRRLDSIADVQDDDPTAVRNFKTGELAGVLAQARFVTTLWKVLAAIAVVGGAVATIYSAVHK